MGLVKWIGRGADVVRPPSVDAWSDDDRLRAQLLFVLCGLVFAVAPTLFFVYLGRGLVTSAVLVAVLGVSLFAAPLIVRLGLGFRVAGHVVAAAFTLGVCGLSWVHGLGYDPSTLAWLSCVVLVSALISGPWAGFIWLLIDVACLWTLFAIDANGIYPATPGEPDRPGWLAPLAATLMCGSVWSFAWLYTVFASRAARSLRRANLDLRSERDRADLARKEAEAANESKTRFLAHMSHEIRTPLNGVIGMANLLMQSDLRAEDRELVQVVHDSGATLLAIINDILDLSKVESGRLPLEAIEVDLTLLVERLESMFRRQAESKGLELRVRMVDAVPRVVVGDPTRIQQILVNLMGNAIKFTSRGGVRLEIEPAPGGVRFIVSDTGPGIAPDRIQDILEPFVQEDASTTRQFGGTGLGLAISRGLVETMKGELRISSEVGRGTRFEVDLPLEPALGANLGPESGSISVDVVPPGMRVLVVEDNRVNQRVATRMLEKLGCICVVAEHGLEACEFLERDRVDVVFMDCHMPVLDGFAATERLRSREDPTPVVALTAGVLAEERARCEAAGMNAFLAKPVRIRDFEYILRRVAGGEFGLRQS